MEKKHGNPPVNFCSMLPIVHVIDSFMKRHKLVHNGGFLKFEVLYCSQNTVKSIKIQ